MAVLPMKKLHIVAMKQDRRKIMEFLQRTETVQLATFTDWQQVYSPLDTGARVKKLETQLSHTEEALTILDEYVPTKNSMLDGLKGRKRVSVAEYEQFYEESETVLKHAEQIRHSKQKIGEMISEMLRIDTLREELVPWMDLSVPLDFSGTKHTCGFVGSISGLHTHQEILSHLVEVAPDLEGLYLEIIYESKTQTCFIAMAYKESRNTLKTALDIIEFQYPAHRISKIPAEYDKELELQKADLDQQRLDMIQQIEDLHQHKEDIQFLADHLRIQIEKQKAATFLGESKHTIIIEGYIPEEQAEKVRFELEKRFVCATTVTEPEEEEDVPVKLKNNRFSEPLEGVIASYSYPGKTEVDPIGIVSIFYYLMFGLMFSDAGYGLILAGVCGFLLTKFEDMEESTNRSLRMFFWCGLSTIFWGVIFSSYFGDVVDVFSRTFLGKEYTIPPVWFTPLQEPMLLLMFCLGIGVLHLTAAYLTGMVQAFKNKDYVACIFDSGFPVLFIVNILIVFVSTDFFAGFAGFSVSVPPAMIQICTYGAMIACAGVVLMSGRESKNIILRLLKGLYALYNMLAGWISDILSYSRLLALSLATGVIGSVINSLGAMGGQNIGGLIMFILVFILGHAINFGLNILGSYVHSNRLEYVEFFGKFYEGGGKPFTPLGIHTKHYKIREDN